MKSPSRAENPGLYQTWVNLRRRCDRPQSESAKLYSLRGISYSEDWKSFKNFYADMATGYKKGLTLERIDNLKGYSKDNCCWATRKEQANNTSRNRLITIKGEPKTLAQWIDETDIKSSTVRQRYYVYKWPIEKAIGRN